jgi:hypothetical protein
MLSDVLRSPIPGHEFVDALGKVIRRHVGKPSLRVDVIEIGGGDEAVDGSRTPAARVGPGEGPFFAAHRGLRSNGISGFSNDEDIGRPADGASFGEFIAVLACRLQFLTLLRPSSPYS